MRVLLDECVPARLGREFIGHEVRTVPEMGWASKENGALLALAEGKFDVVVLVARRNKNEFLLRLLPELQRVIGNVQPGQIYRVGA